MAKTQLQEFRSSRRNILTYVVPNAFTLKALTKEEYSEGWRYADEVIDDNVPRGHDLGHGSAVACVAGGYTYGVASNANLYLIKMRNYYVNAMTGEKRRGGTPLSALMNALQAIYNAVTSGGIDSTKSVINLSLGESCLDIAHLSPRPK